MADKQSVQNELDAIKAVVEALKNLEEQAQKRVIKYALDMLSIEIETSSSMTSDVISLANLGAASSSQAGSSTPMVIRSEIKDIKTLKEEKKPTSSNEMTALVAYYLSELAPIDERKNEISSEDIEKYFKQAGFPLPKQLRSALPNALNSGYLDKASFGKYRLNPVGFNLVAYKLPGGGPQTSVRKPKAKRNKKKISRR